jgi:CheY-like chemotaxis protein
MTIKPPVAPKAAPDTQPAASHLPPTFLYVEDDELSREIMQLLVVKALGYPYLTLFESNVNFMEQVRALPRIPDVIFLDIQMYPYDGYEMLKMLRSDPAYQQCKIIAMTASVMATDVEALRTAGFDGLIGKPIMRQVFPDLLKRILQGEAVWFVS